MRACRKTARGPTRRRAVATLASGGALAIVVALAPAATGQVDLPTAPSLSTDQALSTATSGPVTTTKTTVDIAGTTTTVTDTTGTTTTTVTDTAGSTTTTVKDASGKTVSSTTGTTGAPAATTGAGAVAPAPASPVAATATTGGGVSSVKGAPGTTVRLPDGSTKALTLSTPLPPGTRFETIGRPPPPEGPNVMKPFPVVRIAGTLTRDGARIRVLSARAPGGSLARALCRGGNCPSIAARSTVRARAAQTSGRVRFRVLQRTYRAGVVLRVYVTAPRKWGKYTRFLVRKGLAPKRLDRCMSPGARRRPSPCPG